MKHQRLIVLLLATLLSVSFLPGREIDLEKPSSELRRFASDVIFAVQAGDLDKKSKRLPQSIVVQFHGQAEPRAVAEKHLNKFCQITGVNKVEGASGAKIDIYFNPQSELIPVAKEMERKITLDQGFAYWTWWDSKNTINRAVIFIATDKLSGAALEDKFLELLLGVYGLPSRSKEFDDSCLSLKEQVFTNLQPLDEALLEFYYRAVPVGTQPRDIDNLFRKEWIKKR